MRKKTIDMIPILSEDIKPALSSFAKAAPFRQVWSKEPGSSFWHHRGCLIRRLPHRLFCIITMLQPGETVCKPVEPFPFDCRNQKTGNC